MLIVIYLYATRSLRYSHFCYVSLILLWDLGRRRSRTCERILSQRRDKEGIIGVKILATGPVDTEICVVRNFLQIPSKFGESISPLASYSFWINKQSKQ